MSFVAGSAASWRELRAARLAEPLQRLQGGASGDDARVANEGGGCLDGRLGRERGQRGERGHSQRGRLPGRRGRHQARHDDVGPALEPAHALGGRNGQPGVGRIERRQRRAERRVVVVLDKGPQRFGSHPAVRIAQSFPETCGSHRRFDGRGGDDGRREAADRPEPDFGRRIVAELEQVRRRARVARPEQRPRGSPADIHISRCRPAHDRRDVLSRGEAADREQRLTDDGRGGGGGRCGGQVGGQRGPGLRRTDLPERARRFLGDGGRRLGGREHVGQPCDRLGVLQLPRGERNSGDDLRVGIRPGGRQQRAPLRLGDPPDGLDRAAPHLRMLRLDQGRERRLVEPARVLERDQLDDCVDVGRRQRLRLRLPLRERGNCDECNEDDDERMATCMRHRGDSNAIQPSDKTAADVGAPPPTRRPGAGLPLANGLCGR